MAYGVGAVNGEWAPYGRISAHNRVTELRSRTVLRYSVSNRVTFVGQALGSRLRMIGLTLVRFFGGVKVGAHPSGDRYTPLSESEAALMGARDRTVRRALAPRLSFPGFSLNLGGISVQAGVHVRLF